MRYLIALAMLWLGSSAALLGRSAPDSPQFKQILKEAAPITGAGQLLVCYIPRHGDVADHVHEVIKMTVHARKQHQPLIIYSPDADWATRIIALAFTVVRKNALRDCKVLCAVGQKNDGYIRPLVEATGAKLFVLPLP